jgi:hypothetical protein
VSLALRRALLAVFAAVLMEAGPASAAAPLELLAPAKAELDVRLGPVADGARHASATLLVRNSTDDRRRLILRFTPADGSEGATVARSDNGALINADEDTAKTLAAQASAEIRLRFRLPDGSRRDRLSGTLTMQARPTDRARRQVAPLTVSVRASLEPLSDVVARPSTVEMQTTEILWSRGFRGHDAVVVLSGARANALLAEPHPLTGRTVLRNAEGHSATVGWTVVERDGRRQAAVHLEGEPEAGEYKGFLPLSDQTDEPRVELTVRAHHWIGWAILTVLAGALVGGLLPHLGGLSRRKNVLRANVRGALERYKSERAKREHPLSYDLDELLGPQPWDTTEWLALPGLHGAAGLFSSIHWARSDADLDEDTDWAQSLITSVQRWLRIEEQTAELRDTADKEHPADLEGREWDTTGVYRDTERLLIAVRDAPADDTAAERLVTRLRRQGDWHTKVAALWRAIMDLDDPAQRAALAADLFAFTDPPKGEPVRDDAERIELLVGAEELQRQISVEAHLAAASAAADAVAPARPGLLGRARAAVRATLDAPMLVSIRQRLGQQAGSAATGATGLRPPEDAEGLLRRISRESLLLSALLVAVAIVGYVVPLYTDTWGSTKDYVTAFAAGFGTQAVVRWALLPMFASLRARKAPAAEVAGV